MKQGKDLSFRLITHLMLVGASLFWGINPMLMKIGLRELSPLHFNLLRLFVALSPYTWFSAGASGILALSAGNILWSGGVKRIGSVNTSVYGNLPPVFGVAAGILILGETLQLLQIIGALGILGGVFIVNSRPAQRGKQVRRPQPGESPQGGETR